LLGSLYIYQGLLKGFIVNLGHGAQLGRERGRVDSGVGDKEVINKRVGRVGNVSVLGAEKLLRKSDRVVTERVQG
jgi:hypothetical protein